MADVIECSTYGPKALSNDCSHLVVGTNAGRIEIWSRDNDSPETVEAHGGEIEHVSFEAGDRIIASVSHGELALWDAKTLRPITRIPVFRGANVISMRGYSFAVGDDATVLAYAKPAKLGEAVVVVYDIQEKQILQEIQLSTPATSIAISQNNTVAIGEVTGRISVFDARRSSRMTFQAHTSAVFALTFSPEGQRLASAAMESIKLWDVPSYRQLIELGGHQRRITSLSFSASGNALASAGYEDGNVHIWRAPQSDTSQ